MLLCVRTTITLRPELLKAAKAFALERGTSLRAVIENALQMLLASVSEDDGAASFELITFCGEGGARPGIDLDKTSELLDLDL